MPHTLDIRHQLKLPRSAGRTGRSSNENKNDEQRLSCSFCNRQFDNEAGLTDHIANHVRLRERYFSGSRSSPRFCKGGSYTAEVKSTGNDAGQYNLRIRHYQHTVVSQEAMNEKSRACPYCDQYFIRKIDLTTHVKIHSEKNVIFPSSTRSFRRGASGQLTGSDGFTYRHCGRSFSKKENLQRHTRTHINEKPFACPSCSCSFDYKSSLSRHIKTHTNEKPFACPSCSRTFSQKCSLGRHIRAHTNEKPFACFSCGRSFNQKSNLKTHIRIQHTNEKPFTCSTCNRSFSMKCNLKTHIRTHTNEKPFTCSTCNRSFSMKCNLKTHIRTHTNEKPFTCSTCNRSFSLKFSLKNHIRNHANEKPFACPSCSRSFSLKCNLRTHIRTHTNEKPFACPSCSRSFSLKYNLKTHIRIHTNEKPFACPSCSHSFSCHNSLKRHVIMHTDKRPFPCPSCNRSFNDAWNLKRHVRIHTNEKPFACTSCSRLFREKGDLKRHVMIHTNKRPFSCPSCSSSFNRREDLKIHVRTHTYTRPFSCSSCSVSFNHKSTLVKHIITHANEKPFSCHSCHHSFNRRKNLIQHIRNHCKGVPESHPAHRILDKCQHHHLDNLMKQLTEKKHFSCHSCNKSFRVKQNLRIHVLTHIGKDSFNQNDNLKTPDRVQSQKILFPCPSCSSSFSQEQDLNVHITTHTTTLSGTDEQSSNQEETGNMQLVSSLEQSAFTLPSDSSPLNQKTDFTSETPFSCDNCGQSFAKKISLKKHILDENDRARACHVNPQQIKPQIPTSTNKDLIASSFNGSTENFVLERSTKRGKAEVRKLRTLTDESLSEESKQISSWEYSAMGTETEAEVHISVSTNADSIKFSSNGSTRTFPAEHSIMGNETEGKELHVLTSIKAGRSESSASTSTETSPSECEVRELLHVFTATNKNSAIASSSSAFTETSPSETGVRELHILTASNKDPIASSSSASTEISPSETKVREPHVLTATNKDPIVSSSIASTETSLSEAEVRELHVLTPANTDSIESSSNRSTEAIPSSSCPCCGRSFHVRAYFLKQIDVYGKGNHLLCLFCRRMYPSWHLLQNHLKKNHRPFLCSSCNLAFRDLVQLNKHIFDFADEKHVICCTYCTNQVDMFFC